MFLDFIFLVDQLGGLKSQYNSTNYYDILRLKSRNIMLFCGLNREI